LEPTRIVLIDMSPLLREIVRETLAREPDLDVVAEHEADADVRAAVERESADFVIVGSDAGADAAVRSLVAADRGVRALELRADGRDSVLYELRPHRVALGEISPETLLRTIRTAPTWEAEQSMDDTSERRRA
jgi:DNA-binding NarL/FixJ family response regulator